MFVDGCIVMMDIDSMEEFIKERGLTEYKPNIATGFLTRAVESLAVKYNGVVVYGLDYARGTEEVVIEFPLRSCLEVVDALEEIKREFAMMGLSITTVCKDGLVTGKRARTRGEAFKGTPWRRAAYDELLRTKRKRHAAQRD